LPADGIYYQDEDQLDSSLGNKANKLTLELRNPNFGFVRTLMVGSVRVEKQFRISKEKCGLTNFD
jgi:hypothetical protein